MTHKDTGHCKQTKYKIFLTLHYLLKNKLIRKKKKKKSSYTLTWKGCQFAFCPVGAQKGLALHYLKPM